MDEIPSKKAIPISYQGDEKERLVLKELSWRLRTPMSHLTRGAMEKIYGSQLAEIRADFAAKSSQSTDRPND